MKCVSVYLASPHIICQHTSLLNKLIIHPCLSSVRHTVFWTASLHILPVCQYVYLVSWSILEVVLTCVSSGTDVSSEGQANEGNGHNQNRGLLVAQQEVWAGYWTRVLGCSEAVSSIQTVFPAEAVTVDQSWWPEQMEAILYGAWAVTDKARCVLRVLLYSSYSFTCKTGLKLYWSFNQTTVLMTL